MNYEISFNPRAAVPDFDKYRRARSTLNEAARSAVSLADLPYGPHERHRVDLYLPERNPAGDLHIYFHGGYWRAGDKENFAFLAKALADRGIAVAVPNYELCGRSTFEHVVGSALAAFKWVVNNAQRHGCSPLRISLSGHSAGAYLCAYILTSALSQGLDTRFRVLGATLVSGVYTPSVAIGTSVNDELGFVRPYIDRFDMAQMEWDEAAPANVFVGENEPSGWISMSSRYAELLNSADSSNCRFKLLDGHDHFSILDEYRANRAINLAICAQHGIL